MTVTLRIGTPQEADKIIKDPELFDRVKHGDISIDDYESPQFYLYVIIEKEGEPIGFWVLHYKDSETIQIHCNILKDHRSNGVEAGHKILKFIDEKFRPSIKKIYAEIPVIFPDVYHFTKKFGFKDSGLLKENIVKNGKKVDSYQLILDRSDINGLR